MINIVRRGFRNYGEMVPVGSIVDPEDIRRFKNRVRDRCIIQIDEQELDAYKSFFKVKYGAELTEYEVPKILQDFRTSQESSEADEKPSMDDNDTKPDINENKPATVATTIKQKIVSAVKAKTPETQETPETPETPEITGNTGNTGNTGTPETPEI